MSTSTDEGPVQQRRRLAPASYAECRATVVGLGGIGRLVALHLASLGVGQLWLVDAGKVSRARRRSEGYFAEDIGRPKALATAELCHRLNPGLEVQTLTRLGIRQFEMRDAVFCCSRSPEVHRRVWQLVGGWAGFFASALATQAGIRILVAYDVPSEVATEGRLSRIRTAGEGQRTIIVPLHAAQLAAGLMTAQFDRFMHGRRPTPHLRLSLSGLKLSSLERE